MASLYERSGDRLRLHMHAGQLRAWDSTKRIVAIIAGTQSGKTAILPIWLWREIKTRGPGDYGFVSPNFTLMEVKALPEFKKLFVETFQMGTFGSSPVRKFTLSSVGAARLFGDTPWQEASRSEPTHVYFGHAENPDSLESATFKAVVADEAGQRAFKRESYEALMRRLAIHKGRLLIGTTPYFIGGWLKSEILDKADTPDVDVINFPSTANPAFPREDAERARLSLPSWKYQMFYLGIATRPAGLIYDCFDTVAHVIPQTAVPPTWPRYLGVDFGAVNTAGVFLAAELDQHGVETGRLFAYREYRAGNRSSAEHAASMLRGEPGVPTAVGGAPRTEDGWREAFRAGGLPIREPAIKEVEVGIDRVYATIRQGQLIVMDHLTRTLDQLASYSRVVDDRGEPTEEIEAKASYHELDAIRYLVGWKKGLGMGDLSALYGTKIPGRSVVSAMPKECRYGTGAVEQSDQTAEPGGWDDDG